MRAIRRLSSFGASLLGKSSSLLRTSQAANANTQNSLITEESLNEQDNSTSNVTAVVGRNPDKDNESAKSPREKTGRVKDSVVDSNEVDVQSIGRLNELKQKFQVVTQVFKVESTNDKHEGSKAKDVKAGVITDRTKFAEVAGDKELVRAGRRDRWSKEEDIESRDKAKHIGTEHTQLDGSINPSEQTQSRLSDSRNVIVAHQRTSDTGRHSTSKEPRDIIASSKPDICERPVSRNTIENSHLKQEPKATDVNQNNCHIESLEDTATKDGLHNYLQRMIKEGKLPGEEIVNMPIRQVSWSSGNAASRRGRKFYLGTLQPYNMHLLLLNLVKRSLVLGLSCASVSALYCSFISLFSRCVSCEYKHRRRRVDR